jgi:hypothetical protein
LQQLLCKTKPMKSLLLQVFIFISISTQSQTRYGERLIVIAIDGVRWQEIYVGASKNLLADPAFTSPGHFSKSGFWQPGPEQRRAL